MDAITRALAELKKVQIEATITAMDYQATVLALKATLLEIGGQKAAEVLVQQEVIQKHKRLAERSEYQTALQILQKEIEKTEALPILLQ
jgi:hypothetical protein